MRKLTYEFFSHSIVLVGFLSTTSVTADFFDWGENKYHYIKQGTN